MAGVMMHPFVWLWTLSLLLTFGLAIDVEVSIHQLIQTFDNTKIVKILRAIGFAAETSPTVASMLAYPEHRMLAYYLPTAAQVEQLLPLAENTHLHSTLFNLGVLRLHPQLLDAITTVEYTGDFWAEAEYVNPLPCLLDSRRKMQLWTMARDRLGNMSSFSFWGVAIEDASTAEELWYIFDLIVECDLNPVLMSYLYGAFPSEYQPEFLKRLLNVDSKNDFETILRCISVNALFEMIEDVDDSFERFFDAVFTKIIGEDSDVNVYFTLLKRLLELGLEYANRSFYGTLLYLSRSVYWKAADEDAQSTKDVVFSILQSAIPNYIAPAYFKSQTGSHNKRFSLPIEYLSDHHQDLSVRRLIWLRTGPTACISGKKIVSLGKIYAQQGIYKLALKLVESSTIPLNMNIDGLNLSEMIHNQMPVIFSDERITGANMVVILASWAYLIASNKKHPFGEFFNETLKHETWKRFFKSSLPNCADTIVRLMDGLKLSNLFSIQDLRSLIDSDYVETEGTGTGAGELLLG